MLSRMLLMRLVVMLTAVCITSQEFHNGGYVDDGGYGDDGGYDDDGSYGDDGGNDDGGNNDGGNDDAAGEKVVKG